MLWFDLDNSPHVPLFRPVFAELQRLNEEYVVTAREFAQTKELLDLWKIRHSLIGSHAGAAKIKKLLNLLVRSSQLVKYAGGQHPDLCVSHGSRSQVVAAKRLGLPSVVMLDYEYTEARIFNALGTRILMPSMIPDQRLRMAGFNLKKIVRYNAFKEELYLEGFLPREDFRARLGIDRDRILVIARPPSTTGNYHHPLSESLFRRCLDHCASAANVVILVANRTPREAGLFASFLHRDNIRLLESAVDGLQLLWHADLVISGGGTMNREAALLGVPAYSIFTGKRPYLDSLLQEQGRLRFLESLSDVDRLPILKRPIPLEYSPRRTGVAASVTRQIVELRQELCGGNTRNPSG